MRQKCIAEISVYYGSTIWKYCSSSWVTFSRKPNAEVPPHYRYTHRELTECNLPLSTASRSISGTDDVRVTDWDCSSSVFLYALVSPVEEKAIFYHRHIDWGGGGWKEWDFYLQHSCTEWLPFFRTFDFSLTFMFSRCS